MIKIINVPSLYSGLFESVNFCKDNESEIIEIIVPDKLSLFMEKFLFEKLNITSSFNIKVSTFNRFAKRSCIVDKSKQISKTGSILLIHKILNENINQLNILRNKAYSFSYAEDIFKTISQLKASRIGFEEMLDFSCNDIRLKEKIKDIAIVYEQYENLKAGLLDSSDLFLLSSLTVANGNENSKLLFVGFDDFTAIEYTIIERLAFKSEVNIINYSSKADNKFIYNNEIVSQLKNIALINQLPYEIINSNVNNDELKSFLENNLFSFNTNQTLLKDKIIKVFSGNSVGDELEFVARDIKQKVINGLRFDDFGVAVYGIENNISKVQEVFEKYDLNYYIDTQLSINKSVVFTFFLSVLKYNLDGYNLSNLIDLINSPFLRVSRQDKNKVINKLISVDFRGKNFEHINFNLDEEIQSELSEFLSNLVIDRNQSIEEVINQFKNLNCKLNLDEVLTNLANNNVENKVLLLKSKDVIFSLFDEILRFNPNIDLDSFYDIFLHIAGVVKINNLPLSLDAIKVVDANNTMEIFNELYVVNMTQSNAPNLKYDCGIILDNEIAKLNFSNKLSPTISHINKLAKLRLFNTLMLFENELNLTCSNMPSEVIKEMLNRVTINTKLGVKNIVPISRFDFDKYVALSKWDLIEFSFINKKLEIAKNNQEIIKNKDFSLKNSENLQIFSNLDTISATTLESYFKCPMLNFFANIVKIKPRIDNEILAFDIGNILHEIMFKYYKYNKKITDIYDFCKNEIYKAVDKNERLKLNIKSPILVNLIDEAVRVINAVDYIDENSDFEPKYFELDFKNDKALKLKNISVIGKVDRVDVCNDMFRIVDYKSGKADANLKELYYGNKLQLFLYSCAMENVLKKSAVGSFYLPLHNAYTRELSNTYSMKGFYLAEDFVVRSFDKRLEAGMKSDIVNVKLNKAGEVGKMGGNKELNSAEFSWLKNYSKSVSENAVEEMKGGYIEPTPSGVSKPCEFCPYVHICLRKSNGIKYREARKIDLESFKEVNDEEI